MVLVIPIDESAPKGRLILPQQQTIRDILDCHAQSQWCVQDTDVERLLLPGWGRTAARWSSRTARPLARVSADTPEDIPLTSFSILFARHKGNLAGS